LLAGERLLLELIATGTPLPEVLQALTRFIETHSRHGALASILLLDRDGQHLRHGAAPSLPMAYTSAVDGVAIGPEVGSCGTAAYLRQPVFVEDIATHPVWKDYAQLALPHGLRACWSTPILSRSGDVLGTFAVYHRTTRSPDASDLEAVGIATHIAGIAIERARVEEDVRASEARKSAILEASLDCVITIDHDGRVLEFNAAAEQTFGYAAEDVLGEELADLIIPPRFRERHRAGLARWREEGAEDVNGFLGRRIELVAMRSDGTEFPVEISVARLDLAGPGVFTASLRDIGERQAAKALLDDAHNRYQTLVEHLPLITYIDALDEMSSNIYTSPQIEPLLGYTMEEWRDDESLFVRLLHPDDRDHTLAAHAASVATGSPLTIEYRLISRDGRVVWFRDGSMIVEDGEGRPSVRQGYLLDITDRREVEDQLRHLAYHDPLTGLPNRSRFTDDVAKAALRNASSSLGVAVIFLDLDDFKTVNDSLGHSSGDELLESVGKRIAGAVRKTDTVARFGGDEFAVLLEEFENETDAAATADQIADALRSPFHVDGREVFVAASIGIAFGHDTDELLRCADVAMYRAKGAGKSRHMFYDPSMDAAAHTRLELTADMRRAALRGEFLLEYQPTVELTTGRPTGFEALIRWRHPQRGIVPPLEFIPLAEETGLVVPIGRWALVEACAQAEEWRQRLDSGSPVAMSVNLSARQLQRAGLVEDVACALDGAGFPASSLTLELTESVLVQGGDEALETLHDLKRLGVKLALDDFGTGYSSLSYLRDLPVDIVKIDRSFVDGVDREEDAVAMLRGIVQLATGLGLTIVAEGIERFSQADALRELGCVFGQGFYFWRPLDASAAEALLGGGNGKAAPVRRAS
jgi:diguanylate cyclase (GGDEF)-like protein/PAS domain S-box-containing protein